MKTKHCFSIILLTVFFLAYREIYAQSPNWLWAKAMNGTDSDDAISIALDASGNVYTTGAFRGTVDFDPSAGTFFLTSVLIGYPASFISKLDGSGNFVWAKAMSGAGGAIGYSIALDGSGNVYTTGYFNYTVDFDPGGGVFNLTAPGVTGGTEIFISKLDNSGNFVWAKAMGGTDSDGAASIAPDASGNVYTTGYFFGTADFDPGAGTFNLTSSGNSDFFISKLNSSGNFVWAKAMGGTSADYGNSIAIDTAGSGDVYATGYFDGTVDFDPGAGTINLTSAGFDDIFISKLNSSGNFVWAKAMGGTSPDHGNSIALDPAGSGDVYATGWFTGTADFDPGVGTFHLTAVAGGSDIFICKLDGSGNFLWAKGMGGATGGDVGNSMAVDPAGSGDVYTTGGFHGTVDFDPGAGTFNLTTASVGSWDLFISKLDGSGNFVWAKAAGGTSNDAGQSLVLDGSGNVFVTGSFQSPDITFGSTTLTNADSTSSSNDIFIAKLDHITGIESMEFAIDGSVFPNPSNGEFTVDMNEMPTPSINRQHDISIYNVPGEKVYSTTIKSQSSIINLDAPNGIYFLHIKTENNSITQKLIIQK